jgi:hypothetical protein
MPHQPFPARQLSRIGLTPDEIPAKVGARRTHRAASLTGRLRVDDGRLFPNPRPRNGRVADIQTNRPVTADPGIVSDTAAN